MFKENPGETKIQFVKTYATPENARKAVRDKGFENLRHAIMPVPDYTIKGIVGVRYAPMFIGEIAMQHMVHFHFNVVG